MRQKRPFSSFCDLPGVFYATYCPLDTLGHLLKGRRVQIGRNRVKKIIMEK